MPSVFICSDPRDNADVDRLTAELDHVGVAHQTHSWKGGDSDDLPRSLKTYIEECAAFIPVVSKRCAQAGWLDIQVGYAMKCNKLVYALKLRDCTFHGNLEFIQYEWFNELPSSHWFERLRSITARSAPLPSRIFRGHEAGVWCLAYERGSGGLATGSWDRTVRIWTKNPQVDAQADARRILPQGERVLALAYAPEGSELAIGCEDGSIRIWSPVQHCVTERLSAHTGAVRSLAYSSSGETLFSASVDGTARLWSRPTDERNPVPRSVHHGTHDLEAGRGNNVLGVACAPDDATFATVSEDKTVRVWNNPPTSVEKYKLRHGDTSREDTVWGVAYSPAGSQFASVGRDRTARVWDLGTGNEVCCLRGHAKAVISVAYSADGRFLATGSADETARIWEIATARLVATLTGHSDAVRAVAFAPDEQTLTTAGADGTVMDWRLPPEVRPRH
jgi:WD40 repeat protein